MLKAVFFDLDGTLLPSNEDEFTKLYFYLLSEKAKPFGYEPEKLIATVWQGTKAMFKNDGTKSNEKVFWECFKEVYGEEKLKDISIFDEFYHNEFKQIKRVCGENKEAKKIVDTLNKLGLKVILTTNPIFPLCGIETRLSFIDLSQNDFSYITSYENSRYCKPNPNYFLEVLEKNNLKADEVILFGNNDVEDYACAVKAGIKCYLVGDCIISHPELNLNPPQVSFSEIIEIVKKEIEE